ncbi:MAG: lantibiotic dehydratase [Egibacteraceae bacterium]
MDLALADVVFLRLSAGDPEWLADLRWSPGTLALLREHRCLADQEADLARRALECERELSAAEWASLQAWLRRALRQGSVSPPRILDREPEARLLFRALVEVRRKRAALEILVDRALEEEEAILEERVFERLCDPRVRLIVANASRDFTASLDKLVEGRPRARKKRRRLARTMWALMARSTYKSCPLAFAADTGVLLVHGEGPTLVLVGRDPHVTMRPTQQLSNQLITSWRPTARYLKSTDQLHLNVAAWLDGERLLWWRTIRVGGTVRESLATARLPEAAHVIINRAMDGVSVEKLREGLTDREGVLLHRLVEQEILAREDLVTPLDWDPWRKVEDALGAEEPNETAVSAELMSYREAQQHARRFCVPQCVDLRAPRSVTAALASLRELSDQVLGCDRVPSSGVSIDTYREASGDLSGEHLESVRRGIEQYFLLAGLAYPSTPTCRRRQRFIEHFRDRYGDGVPVQLERLLIDDWQVIHRAVSFLLSPDHSPIHSDNDLVWPEPGTGDGLYANLYQTLQAAAASGRSRYEIEPVDHRPPILRSAYPVVDAICRLGHRDGGRLDVFVESATVSGRLVERHLSALRHLGAPAAEAVDRYVQGRPDPSVPDSAWGAEPVLLVASHAIPRLQNLCAARWSGELLLPITEPVPTGIDGSLLRYSELYVRFDGSRQGFVVTRGPDGVPLAFTWPSPLSPSFSRPLHFLRFLNLAAAPVITAPRWLAFEATTGGHLPRLQIGSLVLSPERWSVPLARFASCLSTATRAGRYRSLRGFQEDLGLPGEAFVFTSHDTRPAFVDFASPWGVEVFLHVLRKGAREQAATVLVEERLPDPGQEIIGSPSGSCSLVFQCFLTPGYGHEEGPSC